MKSKKAQALLDDIDKILVDYKSFLNISKLEESYLAYYLTVYISGIYEETIETIINEMINYNTVSFEIKAFIKLKLDKTFRNPSTENILKLLKDFNNLTWERSFKLIPQINKDALDSIVNNKNLIAHGQPSTITLGDVEQFYRNSRILIETIDTLLL